ncbi:MAG: alpha/beta fold hydrolase [Proteobacteria bacterium]|nr:alpha/beta fold hydrolase [Pseudomonadota bacterium]
MGAAPGYLLLHGLAATGAVWAPLAERVGERAAWLAPDLAGHGSAPRLGSYTLESMTAALPALPRAPGGLIVIGHSFGGYVAAALADGRLGVQPRAVILLGTKVEFSATDRERAADLARRPARRFATTAEAEARYRLVAGLDERIAPGSALLGRGTVAEAGGFRLATDPAVLAVEVPSLRGLLEAARCPVILARGEHDAVVSSAQLRAIDPQSIDLAGAGHNVHVEDPAAVAGLVERALARAQRSGVGRSAPMARLT